MNEHHVVVKLKLQEETKFEIMIQTKWKDIEVARGFCSKVGKDANKEFKKVDEIKLARSLKKKANMNLLSSELTFTSEDGGLLIINVMKIIHERIG